MLGVTMWPSECGPGPSEVFDRTLETASRPPVIWESEFLLSAEVWRAVSG